MRLRLICVAATCLTLVRSSTAEVKLPAVLDSHMVIQRDEPVRIWGTAAAGEEISVHLGSETQKAITNDAGRWLVTLKPQKADGRARTITVKGTNQIELTDVLVGEVWIGSGQSNMEWQLRNTQDAAAAIEAATHPTIRLFHVPKKQMPAPADDVVAKWKDCTPESIPAFSAVLYYFGRELQNELGVPVGLINSSWGGSPIEPWTIKGGKSGGMYNGMIAPLTNVSVRGTIWYQGETNVLQKNGLLYEGKMTDLIAGWRDSFGNPDMAFHFVQIAPWSGRYEPGQLPALWEAQTATLKIPNTGMAVTTDLVDNIADIHPRNKLDVGKRLSLWALTQQYGRSGIVYSGPLYQSMSVEGNAVRLKFAHADGLKSADGEALTHFEVTGDGTTWVPAVATIDGTDILIRADGVTSPKHVRFAWNKVAQPNLVNGAGLPASPFQTDQWRGGTGTKDTFQPLFNGKDLSGWAGVGGEAGANWNVSDGILTCTGEPGAGWIAFEKEYSDFELSLEFNVPKDANSGVFFRAPRTGDPWVTGMEAQLLDDNGEKWKSLKPAQYTGAIYAVVPPSTRATKAAGEWQTMTVWCVGSECRVGVNGTTVVDVDLSSLTAEQKKKVPGVERRKGVIGLQNHGDRIQFRNLQIRDLSVE